MASSENAFVSVIKKWITDYSACQMGNLIAIKAAFIVTLLDNFTTFSYGFTLQYGEYQQLGKRVTKKPNIDRVKSYIDRKLFKVRLVNAAFWRSQTFTRRIHDHLQSIIITFMIT